MQLSKKNLMHRYKLDNSWIGVMLMKKNWHPDRPEIQYEVAIYCSAKRANAILGCINSQDHKKCSWHYVLYCYLICQFIAYTV